MDKYSNSKWTSVNKIFGWRHFEVRNVLKKQKKIELFSVCDKSISIIINIDEIENKEKWLPGWKEIV
ncbi:MAG: TIGR02450 family Trp-rich protein [Candidatus Marinimicrobia bacterium]|nr:TIGR02450 family Trp-rich protein [Candidatus Neomarinimicrobiota bacterium]|tara:strand:+ start:854 stop:1054 length:201 start_codon:yes stop_codon:yes gene_type:complete